MTIIVMTREMGTLGKDVAREFAQRKGISVIHHELVETPLDRKARTEESEVFRFIEGSEKDLTKWRDNRALSGYLTAEEIYQIALEGEVLIRGWGATRLLQSIPNILSIRVCAPMEFRIEQMMGRLGVGELEARREIERSDAAHGKTFMRFFQSDWRDPLHYDLVLNTAHLTPSSCAEILLDAVANPDFDESEASKSVLHDRLLEARISRAISTDEAIGNKGQHIRVSVEKANVRLYGVVSDGLSGSLAEHIAATQDGVRDVHNEIARINSFSS